MLKEVVNGTSDVSACDALITSNAEVTLGVHTRDCAPVCFADGKRLL